MTIEKHFVTFYSPGTFVAETTEKTIDSWDIAAAVEMAKSIKERHAAIPYGFRFTTRSRGDNDLDSHETKRSGMFFLGGKVETLEEIEQRGNPADLVLISNMHNGKYSRVVTNTNSWKWTQPLGDDDVVLDVVLTSDAAKEGEK